MLTNKLTNKLKIKYPIIQAPMAGGITTNELVIATSLNGGLGMIGAGYMTPNQLQEQIQTIKKQTTQFGVNLFVPQAFTLMEDEINEAEKILRMIQKKLQVENEQVPLPTVEAAVRNYYHQIDIIIEEKVPVCSFTFGIPEQKVIHKLTTNNILTIGTATTVEEAAEIERVGMDIVVVQGSEAGGHRGNFLSDTEDSLIGLMSLIPQVVDQVNIPVIAAGGIMDGRGLMAALCLGATAVQMGTAFMLTEESGTHFIHQEAILQAIETDTTLTRAFSGKFARGIKNEFIETLRKYEDKLPTFPIQNTLTQSIRKAAGKENNSAYMSLWAGQSPRLAKKQSVATLIEQIVGEAERIFT